MTYLEEVFRKKADGTDQAILVAQWEYDKQVVSEALKAVVHIFPHYSQHDESHSISILNNLVNVLGKSTVDQLTCTDLWLILEATYCHDLGMVITADMIHEALKGDFPAFVEQAQLDDSATLFPYASLFKVEGKKLQLNDSSFTLEAYDAVAYLFSAYFRGKHATNSRLALRAPEERLSLPMPRALISGRLYNVLGDICASHTQPFEQVMQLDYIENGLTVEPAHPRFVACLLRIGDVLDLDNNRFSEVMQRTLHEMPQDSRCHKEKHLSITHLRIDSKVVEFRAKCPNPQVAKETQNWFEWIRTEFSNQTLSWNQIVPEGLSYHLPNVSQMGVEIDGNYENVDLKNSPRFTIDTYEALDLLKGNNLYTSPFDSIRELLQNAIDSTLIRFYLDHREDQELLQGISEQVLRAMGSYAIQVTVDQSHPDVCTVSIADQGIGLKREHLTFLCKTGSSSKNIEKNRLMQKMPDWLRPSGVFGIGFQSVFLLTDCVYVQTKDYFTDDSYGLEMHNPNSRMRGDIYKENPSLAASWI